ncbi:D-lactate dehydrogenase [Lachnospiraceae bacterium KM106-2]|nr:D-lactate dehydrogenase [Lachnospiraceae bacterium KM106-2]
MKIFVWNYRDFDEAPYFTKYAAEYGIELGISKESPTLENAELAKGYDCLSVITTKFDASLLQKFYDLGIRMISTRTIGYDHIDLKKAKELGIMVSNAAYDPSGVADYTIMLMLMSIRKMKRIMQRAVINDFSLPGNMGGQLSKCTIGVIGTGKIGTTVIKDLSGFGCKLYAHDVWENEAVKEYAEYVDLETIYNKCDIITLHMPLNKENKHMINSESIDKMKDGVILINTARGGLINTKDLIQAIESDKIGAVGLDVIEDEYGLYYNNLKDKNIGKRELSILRDFPNVTVTPHMAFYTDQAIHDMVQHSIQSCYVRLHKEEDPWKII